MNLMAYGNRLGWNKIEVKLHEVLGFIQKAKDSSGNDK